MLNIMTKPYPDEIFYSWVARYHKHSGNLNGSSTTEDLFGMERKVETLLAPSRLEYFCNQLPSEWGFTPEYIIDNHTVYPIYKVFMQETNIPRILNGMIEDDINNTVKLLYGNSKQLSMGREIKVCFNCYNEDIINYGEAYLHRSHQVPGCTVCYKHAINLTTINSRLTSSRYELVNVNHNNIEFDRTECVDDRKLLIAREMNWLLTNHETNVNLSIIQKKYEQELRRKGYMMRTKINQKDLWKDFSEYYHGETINEFILQLNSNRKSIWLRELIEKTRICIQPIEYLLFIHFVFGNLENCLKYKIVDWLSIDEPFACLNPIVEHYGKEVIDTYQTKIDNRDYKIKYIIACSCCGFTYLKKRNSNGEWCDYLRVVQYGHIWENKLSELITGDKLSISEIAKRLKCSIHTVYKCAFKLGLMDKLNSKVQLRTKQNTVKSNLEKNKSIIEDFLKENPGCTRTELTKKFPSKYYNIFVNDSQWIEDRIPRQKNSMKCMDSTNRMKQWSEVDQELCLKLEKAINDLLNNDIPIRISKGILTKMIDNVNIRASKYLDKVPNAKKLLLERLESGVDFHKRVLYHFANEMKLKNEKLTLTKVRRRIRMTKEEYQLLKPDIIALLE